MILFEHKVVNTVFVSIDLEYRIFERYLPVVGSSDDHLVLEVKLTVVNWGSSAFGEVGVSEDCFHAFESLSISVKQFVANLA